MAINPFPRIQGLDLPTYLPSGARAPEGTFSNIASLGDAIGQVRERSALSELLQGATNPKTGVLDWDKAATAIALSGRDPTRILNSLAARETAKEAQGFRQDTLAETKRAHGVAERQRQEALDKEVRTYRPPTMTTPGGFVIYNPKDGKTRFEPVEGGGAALPPPPDVPPSTPGPGSALPGPTFASAEPPPPDIAQPDIAPPAIPMQAAAVEPDPELAPPYRVAGPPMPPPQAPATVAPDAPVVAPAATPAPAGRVVDPRVDAYAKKLDPNIAYWIRGLADLSIDPKDVPGNDEDKRGLFSTIGRLKPGWSPNDYGIAQERRKAEEKKPTMSPEMAARIGIGGKFLVDLEDQKDEQGNVLPGVRSRIKAGELNKDYQTAFAAQYYKGGPGEIRQLIDSGAEGLIRILTGAGMNLEEASDYANRYKFRFIDNQKESLTKAEQLADTIKSVSHAVETGKADPDTLRKVLGARRPSEFSKELPKVKSDAEASEIIGYAKKAYARDPKQREFLLEDMRRRGIPHPELHLGN